MNKRLKSLFALFVAVATAFIGMAEETPTRVVGPGETFYVGDTGLTQGGNPGYVYDLREGSTLVITNVAAGSGTFWNVIYNTNGLATVDCSQLSTSPMKYPCLARGVRQGGNGALRIKTHASYVRVSSSTSQAVWDARDVQFLDADGTARANGGTLQFEEWVALVHAPTNCVSTFVKNPKVYLVGDGPAFAGTTVNVGEGANFIVCNETKIGQDQTVAVAAGGTLAMHSADYEVPSLKENKCKLTHEGERAYQAAFSIELKDAASSLVFKENLTLEFGGEITGLGAVSALAGSSVSLGQDVPDARWSAATNTALTLAAGVRLNEFEAKDGSARLAVGSGGWVRLAENGKRFALENDGGTVLMGRSASAWQEKVDVWFDMSKRETTRSPGYGSAWEESWKTKCYNDDANYPSIEQVVDWRNPEAKWMLNLTANVVNSDSRQTDAYMSAIVPYLNAGNGPNGLCFLSALDPNNKLQACRIPFYDTEAKKEATFSAKLVVMACRPANGGALLGTATQVFSRGGMGIDKPVAASDIHDIWLDGEKIVPSKTYYDSDRWVVISVDVTGEDVGRLGCDNASGAAVNPKSWAYGEVIVFMSEVNDIDRIEAEAYLAQKWGVPYRVDLTEVRMNSSTNTLWMTGTGLVGVTNGTVRLDGQTTTHLALANARLLVGAPPPTANVIPTENLLGWFDPDEAAGAVTFYNGGTDYLRLRCLPDRRDRELTVDNIFLWVASGREPWLDRRSHGGGPVRGWVDFSEPFDNSGNNLRLVKCTEGIKAGTYTPTPELTQVNVGTGFVVSDSSRGGGSLILTDVSGTSKPFTQRGVSAAAADPIWSDKCDTAVRNGFTRLNGETVDQQAGFTGGPEVLSFRPTEPGLIGVFANYQTGQPDDSKPTGRVGTSFEYLGEMLFYSTALDEASMRQIEAYLMWKWLNRIALGYADYTQTTVGGTGEVVADALAWLPKFDDFSGTVTVTDPDGANFTVTINPETDLVDGAICIPDAVLDLPAEATVTVRFTARPSRRIDRSWRLVTAKGLVRAVDWRVSFDGGMPKGATLVTDDEGLRLDLPSQGMLMIVR